MKGYKAVTLLELLIVMAVIFILSTMSVVAYRSLADSFSINEISLTIAQDIRTTQRAAMLLDREGDERWLHGIGIDFREIESDPSDPLDRSTGRKYTIFKWCSPFDYYYEREENLTGEVPNVPFGQAIDTENARLPFENTVDSCSRDITVDDKENAYYAIETKDFSTHNNLEFFNESDVAFVLFESVSGKAFFYDEDGYLLNYYLSGGELFLNEKNLIKLLNLRLEPMRAVGLKGRNILTVPVSGLVYFEIDDSVDVGGRPPAPSPFF